MRMKTAGVPGGRYLLTNEQNTQSTGAAVAGNSAAGFGPVDILKIPIGVYGISDRLQAYIGDGSMGDKQRASVQVIPVIQALFHIQGEALLVLTAILLANRHFSVLNFNTGLKTQ